MSHTKILKLFRAGIKAQEEILGMHIGGPLEQECRKEIEQTKKAYTQLRKELEDLRYIRRTYQHDR